MGREERKRRGGEGRDGEGGEGERGGDVEGAGKWSAPGPTLALGGPANTQKISAAEPTVLLISFGQTLI